MPESVPNIYNPAVSPRVQQAIADASARTGTDFDYLFSQARLESNFDPAAKASTSSASGLFQFTKQTWLGTVKQHGSKHGLGWAANEIQQNSKGTFFVADPAARSRILALRFQPEAASVMAAEFAGDNHAQLASALGRPPEEVDLYLAHFLGAGGATRFLKSFEQNPGQSAASIFPKAAAANHGVFYGPSGQARSLSEIRTFFRAKLDADNATTPNPQTRLVRGRTYARPTSVALENTTEPEAGPTPLKMLGFRRMPQKLSLEFARDTYARLASMNGGYR